MNENQTNQDNKNRQKNNPQQKGQTRRNVLKKLGALGLGASTIPNLTKASPGDDRKQPKNWMGEITKREAKKIARGKLKEASKSPLYREWRNAEIETPETFYMPRRTVFRKKTYTKSAYVFPVTRNNQNDGYITVSARKEWNPVLEYSKAKPPQHKFELHRQQPEVRSKINSLKLQQRKIYVGGVSYGIKTKRQGVLDMKGLHLDSEPKNLTTQSHKMAKQNTKQRWRSLTRSSKNEVELEEYSLGTKKSTTSNYPDLKLIDEVPAWREWDYGDANTSYPECAGYAGDPWKDWDGCVPIAESMIIGYHENATSSRADEIIDHLHKTLNAGYNGWISLANQSLVENYDHGTNNYQAAVNLYWFNIGKTKKEINEGRPYALGMINGGQKREGPGSPGKGDPKEYGDHCVTVVGYDDFSGNFEIIIHNGYDGQTHNFPSGNWLWAHPCYIWTAN